MANKEKKKRKEFEQRKGLKENKEAAKEDITEHIEQLQRLQAEFENYKKRVEKEKQETIAFGKADLIKDLLSIVDSFELALKNIKNLDDETVKGVMMVHQQLMGVLANEGVKPIEALNCKLDPYKHEVLLQKESDNEDGLILEELQKGYMLKDKVLRTSKVAVSKNGGK